MLTLATSEQELTERLSLDVADIAAYVLNELRPLAEDAAVKLRLDPVPAPTVGEPVLLERLVHNLVANGIRYNRPDGWVAVTTAVSGDSVVLDVSNTGPAVPAHAADSLFDPFRRLGAEPGGKGHGSDNGGFGLGLSIVRAIAHAHGGKVHAEPRDGGGLTVRVTLPTE
jgi:signal transduction histidine kinase